MAQKSKRRVPFLAQPHIHGFFHTAPMPTLAAMHKLAAVGVTYSHTAVCTKFNACHRRFKDGIYLFFKRLYVWYGNAVHWHKADAYLFWLEGEQVQLANHLSG